MLYSEVKFSQEKNSACETLNSKVQGQQEKLQRNFVVIVKEKYEKSG